MSWASNIRCSLRFQPINYYKLLSYVKVCESVGAQHGIRFRRYFASDNEKKTSSLTKVKANDQLSTKVKEVKETAKTASYLGVILFGVGVTGFILFTVFKELFSSNSPNGIYTAALDRCRKDPRVADLLGEPIKGFGEETRRGRRRHVRIFGYEGAEADDIMYVNWLSLIWTGMGKALEMYQPETRAWMQAHSQARFVILRILIEAGDDFVKIEEKENGTNLLLTLDRSKLLTVGREAIGKFLLKLQVYHSTANVDAMRAMYNKYSEVSNEGRYPWAKWRDIIMAHKQPRKMFVQGNTFINGETVELKNYESTHEGLIQSWVDRFPDTSLDLVLEELYDKDIAYYV